MSVMLRYITFNITTCVTFVISVYLSIYKQAQWLQSIVVCLPRAVVCVELIQVENVFDYHTS